MGPVAVINLGNLFLLSNKPPPPPQLKPNRYIFSVTWFELQDLSRAPEFHGLLGLGCRVLIGRWV